MQLKDIRQWVKGLGSKRKCVGRAFVCPDGVTRVVTNDKAYWDALDLMIKEGVRTEERVVSLSWKCALADKEKGEDPEAMFPVYVVLTIFEYYHWYKQDRDGLANDNRERWFDHARREKPYPQTLFFPRVETDFGFVPTVMPLSKIRQYMPAYRS